MTYYLAIDIGASSGRHMLGHMENGKLCLEEIYRFPNEIETIDGLLAWDVEALLAEVKAGIKVCGALGKLPKTVAIDTWGVDYVLLDEKGEEILPCVCYRDPRTEAAANEVAKILPQSALYALTGIQKQNFNTLYQLWCDRQSGRLQRAAHFLMMPDYLAYKLTGVMRNEYTNATTTNLINAEDRTWDRSILAQLGIPAHIFRAPSLPGESVGAFTRACAEEIGFSAEVVLCPSHDTAAAVAACPIDDSSVYISSGTWSLIGTENLRPCLSREAMEANFTNEGGIEYRCRFLKNIMGMWLFQGVRRDLGQSLSFDEMMALGMASRFRERIDPNDPMFVAPESMTEAVRTYLGRPDLPLGDVISSLYHSLAHSYRTAIREIEQISRKEIRRIHIVGGGSKDAYLNRLTAAYTGKTVCTGVKEGTAVGNLMAQLMADTGISLAQAREMIKNTFAVTEITS